MSLYMDWAKLRIGVDLCTDTDIEDVPYAHDASYVPVYSLEVADTVPGEWVFLRQVPVDLLPDEVEKMHWDYRGSVRLLEDGKPVFTCSNW